MVSETFVPKGARDLLALFGDDPRALRQACARYFIEPPSPGALRNWRHRDVIPHKWQLILLEVAARENLIALNADTLRLLMSGDA